MAIILLPEVFLHFCELTFTYVEGIYIPSSPVISSPLLNKIIFFLRVLTVTICYFLVESCLISGSSTVDVGMSNFQICQHLDPNFFKFFPVTKLGDCDCLMIPHDENTGHDGT
jgi:hypothetical protein